MSEGYERYDAMWEAAGEECTLIIANLVRDFGLSFPEEYRDTVAELTANAKVIAKKQEQAEEIQKMLAAINFEIGENRDGWKTYVASVENVTNTAFEYFRLDINLLDTDGAVLETVYAGVDNFAPGRTARLEFMTDRTFDSYELTANYC